ncbi:hypothetical protein BC828DRAFT_397525 [Blastocladiella britannica]|nr:hypothetical protein BC828DRAFT_397525 [Blastocladiella britannica]
MSAATSMTPIIEEDHVDLAAGSGQDGGYDSSSSTGSGSGSNSGSGRKRGNPGLTIDTAASNAAAAAAAAAAATAANGAAATNGATSPTSAAAATASVQSPTSPTAPATPATPLSEDVDFSLVYALHTFVATMEGQVAVVRNEPLILLDDSNSYWWLVKPLRSNTIGYIPAEIIETPYERLARVNQQKNVERALFRSNDIPGAPSKSTRPSLHPKSVVFPVDPRGDIFQYSPAVSEEDSDLDSDYDPQGNMNPEVAAEAEAEVHADEPSATAAADEPMDVDAPAEVAPAAAPVAAAAAEVSAAAEGDQMDVDEPAAAAAAAASSTDDKPSKRSSSIGAVPGFTHSVDAAPAAPTVAHKEGDGLKHLHGKALQAEAATHFVRDQDSSDVSATTDAAMASPSTPTPDEIDPITVLRIFPGTSTISADEHQFKTVVVTKSMSVGELLSQALLKYRVFGPLSARKTATPSADLLADWYLTLSVTAGPKQHHHVLNSHENVLDALLALQKQAEEAEAAELAAAPAPAPAPKKRSMLARFASKLYTPTLLGKKEKHHLAKPILHVISPADTSAIKLMLHQHSAVSPTTSPSSSSRILADQQSHASFQATGTAASAVLPTLIRVEMPADAPTAAAAEAASAEVAELSVAMAKTLKVAPGDSARAVVAAALKKFARAEGKPLGESLEYTLVVANTGAALAPDALVLSSVTTVPGKVPTLTLRRAASRTTLTLAVGSDAVAIKVPGPPSGEAPSPVAAEAAAVARSIPVEEAVPAATADAAEGGVVDTLIAESSAPTVAIPRDVPSGGPMSGTSPSGAKRFSELLSEAQSLDLSLIFDGGLPEIGSASSSDRTATATGHAVSVEGGQ